VTVLSAYGGIRSDEAVRKQHVGAIVCRKFHTQWKKQRLFALPLPANLARTGSATRLGKKGDGQQMNEQMQRINTILRPHRAYGGKPIAIIIATSANMDRVLPHIS